MKNNFELVTKGKKKNLCRKDGSLLFDKWYKKIRIEDDYIFIQKKNGWWNLADSNGKFISNHWLIEVHPSSDGIRAVEDVDGNSNFVKSGKLLLENWCYDVDVSWSEGCTSVQYKENGLWYFIKDNGMLLFEQGFSEVWNFSGGWAGVQVENGLFNYINHDGQYMFDKPLFKITPFIVGTKKANVIFEKGGEWCWIDITGKIVSSS